jgi:hypothetical protein
MYAFAPEKPPSLVGRNFCLAIVRFFAKASIIALHLDANLCGFNQRNDEMSITYA